MSTLGRYLQIAGLIILPLAMFLQLVDVLGRRLHLSEMLIMFVFGVAAFCLGRLMEGHARS